MAHKQTQEQGEKSRGRPYTGTYGMQGRYGILFTRLKSINHPIKHRERLHWSVLSGKGVGMEYRTFHVAMGTEMLDKQQELAAHRYASGVLEEVSLLHD